MQLEIQTGTTTSLSSQKYSNLISKCNLMSRKYEEMIGEIVLLQKLCFENSDAKLIAFFI